MITNVCWSASCEVLILLSDFNETGILAADFRKNTQISNFMKIRLVGAELLHVDRRTDGQTWRS